MNAIVDRTGTPEVAGNQLPLPRPSRECFIRPHNDVSIAVIMCFVLVEYFRDRGGVFDLSKNLLS